jgi:uncharacterized protein (UPF0264 family)
MKLLVSVTSAEEARRAVAGGADIVDVKDPRRGPLGAPSPRVVSEVVQAVGGDAPISVALGDEPALPSTAALADIAFVKVGLRAVGSLADAVAMVSGVRDTVGPSTAVIAASYADARALEPPAFAPAWLPALVERTRIAGALVDTFVKDGRGLYAWLSEAELAELVDLTRAAGGTFGVAGQLRLGELRRVAADVVGVRSAVCRGGDRTSEVEAALVAAAVAEVRQSGAIRMPTPPTARTTAVTPVRRTASGI